MNKFSFYLAPATQVRYYKEASIWDVYLCITDPKVAKRQTEKLRLLADKDQRARCKRSAFHYCTFSGSFGSKRKNDALQQHSGLICFDFDKLGNPQEAKRLLLGDTNFHTVLLFTSPSGDGVKWVIEVDLTKADHLTWFNAVTNYFKQTYGLTTDPACKDVARACFIPYDPECYIDPALDPRLSALETKLGTEGALTDLATRLGATNIKINNLSINPDIQ